MLSPEEVPSSVCDGSEAVSRRYVRSSGAVWSLALALALAACASGSGGSGAGGGAADVITQQQIDESGLDTAMDVVRRYRPGWLQAARSPTSSGVRPIAGRRGMPQDGGDSVVNEVFPRVVLDGVPYGEVSSLSSVRSRTVASIRFVSAADARTRYGSGYEGGAIAVQSR